LAPGNTKAYLTFYFPEKLFSICGNSEKILPVSFKNVISSHKLVISSHMKRWITVFTLYKKPTPDYVTTGFHNLCEEIFGKKERSTYELDNGYVLDITWIQLRPA